MASVYREALVPVTLMSGERAEVMALTFLVERSHPSYAGRLSLAEQAHFVRGGQRTLGQQHRLPGEHLAHLAQLGIRERELERLQTLVGQLCGARAGRSAYTRLVRRRWCGNLVGNPAAARRVQGRTDARRFCYRTILARAASD